MAVTTAPPVLSVGPIGWARTRLFNSVGNTLVTLSVIALLVLIVPPLLDWAVFKAVWQPSSAACRSADGACWGFIVEKLRLMTFGTYPYAEQWRPLVMMFLLLALLGCSLNTDMWGRWLIVAWIIGVPVIFLLMRGGVFGLSYVETERWGGLPLTLILSVVSIVLSFPIAILLALGRRSNLPAIKAICIGFIELVRGVPLITVLFMASLMLPLFMPEGVTVDKLLRALVAFTLFAAAYVAEVIRGGLQAVPKGQLEAADALGLSYWQKVGLIQLPQALKIVIPPIVNTFIGFFKDTSLVTMIGMFDLLGAVRAASSDPDWRPFFIEGLLFVAIVYFVFCYAMASYSRHLERRLNTSHR